MALESSFYLALPSFTWFYLICAYLYLIVVLPSFTQFYLVKRSSGFFLPDFARLDDIFGFEFLPKSIAVHRRTFLLPNSAAVKKNCVLIVALAPLSAAESLP